MSRRTVFQLLLAFVMIVAILFFAGGLSAQGNSEDAFQRVKEVQERHTEKLMARQGVVGTAVGLTDSDQPAVLVLLEVPGVPGIPEALEGVPVRPVVTGKIYALKPPADKPDKPDKPGKPGKPPKPEPPSEPEPPIWPRPVPIGVSTGHPDITAGTIGCRVKSGDVYYALSNNHVYANENKASKGDNVLAPGTYDGGQDPRDRIGTLDDFVPLEFGPRGRNTVDAAIALLDMVDLDGDGIAETPAVGNTTPVDEKNGEQLGYGVPSYETRALTTDDVGTLAVQKYGRTTGLTSGVVDGINATVKVRYSSGFAIFVGQIIITPGTFSAGGDSGSLIVTDDETYSPVGLLFAGGSTMTVANPIDDVLGAFGVSIDGE